MNLKYYLRGLGIGVVVTAVIMSITMGGKTETLSNAEIRERARALGMVEPAGVLTELEEGKQGEKGPQQENLGAAAAITVTPTKEPIVSPETPEPSGEPEEQEEIAVSPSPELSASAEPSPITTPSAEPAPSPVSQPTAVPSASPDKSPTGGRESTGASVIIVVRSGESSYTICKKLEDAGIISSASAFDSYLCSRGYDTKLRTGSFEIPVDAQPEEIARILVPGS